MHLARIALAVAAALAVAPRARADAAFPQGMWAVGDPAACGPAALFIRAHDGALEITGTSGETRVQRVVSGVGRDLVTRSEATGATWAYHLQPTGSALVTEIGSNRRFTPVRCGVDALVGLHPAGM